MLLDTVSYSIAGIALTFGIFAALFDRLVSLLIFCGLILIILLFLNTFNDLFGNVFPFSIFWAIFLCILYVLGNVWGAQVICLIQTPMNTPSKKSKFLAVESCGVCGNNQCKRHRRSPLLHSVPKVPKGFDTALEHVSIEAFKE